METLKKWWEKNKIILNKIVGWIIKTIVIILIVLTVGYQALPKIWAGALESTIRPVVRVELKDVRIELQEIKAYIDRIYTWTIEYELSNIEKQYEKIVKKPNDIYILDVERVLRTWNGIPDNYKTPNTVKKFEMIAKYYDVYFEKTIKSNISMEGPHNED